MTKAFKEFKKMIPNLNIRDLDRLFEVYVEGDVEHFRKHDTVSDEEMDRYISSPAHYIHHEWEWLTTSVFTGKIKVVVNPKRAGHKEITSYRPKLKANELITLLWDYTDELIESMAEEDLNFHGQGDLEFEKARFVKQEEKNGCLIYVVDTEFGPIDFTEDIPDWDPGY